MGKHNKHPDQSPGRNNNDLAANERSKAKLAYKIIIFATATVKLITEILHHTVPMDCTRFDYFRGVLIRGNLAFCEILMGMSFYDTLRFIGHDYSQDEDTVWWSAQCPYCGTVTMLAIALGKAPDGYRNCHSAWLMCVKCGIGSWAIGNSDYVTFQYSQPAPFTTPDHLSPEVKATWEEACNSFTVGAYTACTLMCRKLIFYMAVEEGLPEKNDRNRAPGFEQCIDYLVESGLITSRYRDEWVDSIRVWGNAATHDLAVIEKNIAKKALSFTHSLLQMMYEFPQNASQE
ncbi:MAG: DUF4145 domain-containing protein [Corynebacterium matruchotii]|uniref:DUF4145 domain-containing protein n=1 Tax=Corynebacterium matruchotii TaxID=43768 RepID=UPI0036137748